MSAKIEPCPFCGGECAVDDGISYWVECRGCSYQSNYYFDEAGATQAHNKVARAVRLMPEAVALLRLCRIGGEESGIPYEDVDDFFAEARDQQPKEDPSE